MKTTRIIILLLSAMLIFPLMLCACDNNEPVNKGNLTYKVTVKDALGKPYSGGIVVKFLKNGEQASMQSCDENGVASKEMESGDYTIELAFTDSEKQYHYDNNITLSADKTEAEVILSRKITAEPNRLFVQSDEYDAYYVETGCTYAELDSEHRNYFLFAPKESGNYKFSVIGIENVQIGYYGAPHFVQESNTAEITDNSFTISVSATMIGSDETGTATFVIGIDALDTNATNCILAIDRIGDALKTIEDEPWTIYKKTAELSKYSLPEGYEIKEFDLTASTDTYNLVYNEDDGFYHIGSADGALVLVRLTEDNEYIACFRTILDRSGVSKYFFDADGNLEKRESYSECLLEYFEYVDEAEGVYPLTEDLKYIIQQRGEYVGWWDPESASYRFIDENGYNLPDINNEIAWLLMCCYVE